MSPLDRPTPESAASHCDLHVTVLCERWSQQPQSEVRSACATVPERYVVAHVFVSKKTIAAVCLEIAASLCDRSPKQAAHTAFALLGVSRGCFGPPIGRQWDLNGTSMGPQWDLQWDLQSDL